MTQHFLFIIDIVIKMLYTGTFVTNLYKELSKAAADDTFISFIIIFLFLTSLHIAADDTFIFYFYLSKKIDLMFRVNPLLA